MFSVHILQKNMLHVWNIILYYTALCGALITETDVFILVPPSLVYSDI